jgi:hypothetical protein
VRRRCEGVPCTDAAYSHTASLHAEHKRQPLPTAVSTACWQCLSEMLWLDEDTMGLQHTGTYPATPPRVWMQYLQQPGTRSTGELAHARSTPAAQLHTRGGDPLISACKGGRLHPVVAAYAMVCLTAISHGGGRAGVRIANFKICQKVEGDLNGVLMGAFCP